MSYNYNHEQVYDEIHDVLKACQSFYELPRNHYAGPLILSPRLEDGLAEMNSPNHANPQDPVMVDSVQEDQSFFCHTESPSPLSQNLKEVAKCYDGADDDEIGFKKATIRTRT